MSNKFFAYFLLFLCLALCACGKDKAAGTNGNYPLPSTTKKDGTLLATQRPYTVSGKTYHPLPTAEGYNEVGVASWYGPNFHGKRTSNGEVYDMEALTAAHKILPMNTWVRVTNLQNKKQVVVRINDRGPFVDTRIIDLSKAAARDVGVLGPGTANVEVVALGYRKSGTGTPGKPAEYIAPASYVTGVFTVQVGAFSVKANADKLAAQLKPRWGETFVQKYDNGDTVFYRVRVGKFSKLEQAQTMKNNLKATGQIEAVATAW